MIRALTNFAFFRPASTGILHALVADGADRLHPLASSHGHVFERPGCGTAWAIMTRMCEPVKAGRSGVQAIWIRIRSRLGRRKKFWQWMAGDRLLFPSEKDG